MRRRNCRVSRSNELPAGYGAEPLHLPSISFFLSSILKPIVQSTRSALPKFHRLGYHSQTTPKSQAQECFPGPRSASRYQTLAARVPRGPARLDFAVTPRLRCVIHGYAYRNTAATPRRSSARKGPQPELVAQVLATRMSTQHFHSKLHLPFYEKFPSCCKSQTAIVESFQVYHSRTHSTGRQLCR